MSRVLQYIEKVDIYPSNSTIYYEVNDLTVNYVVPVCPGSKYTIVMDEIGNRLRSVFTTSNPLTATSDISGCISIVSTSTFSAGYSFTYTPSAYGYIVVYVSNAGERPRITITTDGAGGDDKYTIMCAETSSGTSLTTSIYAKAGDFVFCTLTTRSNTTLPDGWNVLAISQTTTSYTQHMSLLYKKVESDGMVDFKAVQSSSARIYINLIAFSDIVGFRYSDGEYFYNSDSYDSFVVERPVSKTVLWALSSNLWGTSSPYAPWTCAEIASPVITRPSNTQRRQANFIDSDGGATRTFVPGSTGTSGIIMWVQVIEGEYNSSGTCELTTTAVQAVSNVKASYISWEADTPEGTSIRLYSKLSNEEYQECRNGGSIEGISVGANLTGETLYVKVEMTTSDGAITPVLKNIHIQMFDASDASVIVLTFDSGTPNSIQRAAGDITVTYDGSGTLVGEGGPVAAFEHTFTPVGLDHKDNPTWSEHVEIANIVSTGTLTRIYYTNTSESEHIDLTNISAVGVLTRIDDI